MDWNDTLIIVGALGELKAYRVVEHEREVNGELKKVYHPELITDLDFIDAHKRLHEVVTDKAGRFQHDSGEEHELQNERKERVIKDAAEVIEKTIEAVKPKRVLLAYTKAYVHKLEEALPQSVKAKIEKIVPADLIKTPANELLEHFS
jgi:hypothetical protein